MPATVFRICCCRFRTVLSPSSGPPCLVLESQAVLVAIELSRLLTLVTTPEIWSVTLVVSTELETVTPVSTLPTVNERPWATSLKVFVEEVTVYPPVPPTVMDASAPVTRVFIGSVPVPPVKPVRPLRVKDEDSPVLVARPADGSCRGEVCTADA